MEKFQEIFDKPENSHFEKVIFISDTPAIGVAGSANKEIYALMSTKELLTILKASIPSESLTGLSWGKSVSYSDSNYKIDVTLTQEKSVNVEIIKLEQEKVKAIEEQQLRKVEIVAVDPEVLDNLMQADALIYHASGTKEPKELSETLTKLGYETKFSSDSNACIQAMNYKEFPVIGLILESEISLDKVLKQLQATTMQTRRSQFSFIVSDCFESANPDQAYGLSISLVLNPSKMDQFESIFNKNLPAWKRVVEPFREALNSKA